MELRKELIEHIKEKGLKKSFVASKIGITPSMLSNYLHEKLFVTEQLENAIRNYLAEQK